MIIKSSSFYIEISFSHKDSWEAEQGMFSRRKTTPPQPGRSVLLQKGAAPLTSAQLCDPQKWPELVQGGKMFLWFTEETAHSVPEWLCGPCWAEFPLDNFFMSWNSTSSQPEALCATYIWWEPALIQIPSLFLPPLPHIQLMRWSRGFLDRSNCEI